MVRNVNSELKLTKDESAIMRHKKPRRRENKVRGHR